MDLHRKGLTDKEISEVLGVTQAAVNYRREKMGLKNHDERNTFSDDKLEETRIRNLENEVRLLKIEIAYLKRILGVEKEKKDPEAWKKLENVGKRISNSWKSDKQSWQLTSEARR